ncbi:MAG: (2Fe-2S)-binding protein [Tepidisphaeraceae bacterium]
MSTPEISFTLNGRPAKGLAGSTVAVAVLSNGVSSFRKSVTGESRAPVCGMGICFECRLTIDGRPHQKSCQILLTPDMNVRTDE